jgi:hypothetical protein
MIINFLMRIYYFIFEKMWDPGEYRLTRWPYQFFDKVFSPAVWWLMVNIVWFEWPRKEQPEMGVTKELWFHDLNLSSEPIKGIYECQIDRPSYTVDLYKVWIDKLPNGTPYCGHEWVRIVDILGYEEPVEEEGPCLRCGGSGYITVGEVVIDGALEQEFEDCEPECIKRQEDESAAWSRMIYARALTRWSCVYCKKLVRDCKCTDIPF